MWTHLKLLAVVSLTLQLFYSCNNTDRNKIDSVKIQDSFKNSLIEKQISNSNFYISLPSDYSITSKDGPDFSVYYFAPIDSAIKSRFSGGLYFGNFPSEFDKDSDSCKTSTVKGKILNDVADWTVYDCNGDYTLQTIINSESGENWNVRIHAFGNAKSDSEMNKVLDIYSTLKQKKK